MLQYRSVYPPPLSVYPHALLAAAAAGTVADTESTVTNRIWDSRLMMVQERWLDAILESPSTSPSEPSEQQPEVNERKRGSGDDGG